MIRSRCFILVSLRIPVPPQAHHLYFHVGSASNLRNIKSGGLTSDRVTPLYQSPLLLKRELVSEVNRSRVDLDAHLCQAALVSAREQYSQVIIYHEPSFVTLSSLNLGVAV